MEYNQILLKVKDVFVEVFENKNIDVNDSTSPNDITSWDSLAHAILISKIENHFQLKFDIMEMMNFETVGDICKCIDAKLS